MELNKLKTFAQNARNTLFKQIKANFDQAKQPDGFLNRSNPKAFEKLSEDIASADNEEDVISKIAYFWFNRFCALRFMDVNGYTSSKVVSSNSDESSIPEILTEAKSGYFNDEIVSEKIKAKVKNIINGIELTSNPDADIYRLLLIAECNYWNKKMPFLFQSPDDYSEYLLPSDLLSTESILQSIRNAMTYDNCQSVEILGWLYQYYISEKKDQIFSDLKKNVKIKPNDIPAATQLFTPEWIVRYLVENSLGKLWMLNHPESSLKESMEYYIDSNEVKTDFLKISSPEEIKICDPCCGSGHMLVYAFDLLYKIYEEQGFDNKEIPELILSKNLYGLELDERASELASFSLLMKAREKDRRFFSRNDNVIEPHIAHINRITFTDEEIEEYQNKVGNDILTSDVIETLKQFDEADNFGSLIIPKIQNADEVIAQLSKLNLSEDLFYGAINKKVIDALTLADYLSCKYQVVVTNPPYMGAKGMNSRLATWVKDNYSEVKSDLFSAFIIRCLSLSSIQGLLGFMTPFVWMFISSYEKLRKNLTSRHTLTSLIQLEYSGFDAATVPICTFTVQNDHINGYQGSFIRLSAFKGAANQAPKALEAIKNRQCGWFFKAEPDHFSKIPGSPIAYWAKSKIYNVFSEKKVKESIDFKSGIMTGDESFIKLWYEVSKVKVKFDCHSSTEMGDYKWFPLNSGGDYRRWFGNNLKIINLWNHGYDIKNNSVNFRLRDEKLYFKPGITWGRISSSKIAFRESATGCVFGDAGPVGFIEKDKLFFLALLSSKATDSLLEMLNPTLNYQVGDVSALPVPNTTDKQRGNISTHSKELIDYERLDWNSKEISWDFNSNDLVKAFDGSSSLQDATFELQNRYKLESEAVRLLEEENNLSFIELYGLEDEVKPDYPISEVTMFCNPYFMYKSDKAPKSDEELMQLQRVDLIKELISYSVGCIFGRYSLDKGGLILCNQGETIDDFKSQVPNPTFNPDDDNVIPVLLDRWFEDDIVDRFNNFLKVTFGEEHYLENLRFIEKTLNVKNKNSYSIRDYFVNEFYADHVKRYKKRPIYWMFKSPKGYFKALIYMHRYQPHTVSRVRNEYLLNFKIKLEAEKQNLESVLSTALDKSDANTKFKRIEEIKKIIADLNSYDSDIMYPLAQKNIQIDLDDGVKCNYIKFGNALEKITGLDKKEE